MMSFTAFLQSNTRRFEVARDDDDLQTVTVSTTVLDQSFRRMTTTAEPSTPPCISPELPRPKRRRRREDNSDTFNTPLTTTATTNLYKRQRRVHFSNAVLVREVAHRSDWEPEHKRQAWYTKPEYRDIKRNVHATMIQMNLPPAYAATMMNTEDVLPEDEFCERGLGTPSYGL